MGNFNRFFTNYKQKTSREGADSVCVPSSGAPVSADRPLVPPHTVHLAPGRHCLFRRSHCEGQLFWGLPIFLLNLYIFLYL